MGQDIKYLLVIFFLILLCLSLIAFIVIRFVIMGHREREIDNLRNELKSSGKDIHLDSKSIKSELESIVYSDSSEVIFERLDDSLLDEQEYQEVFIDILNGGIDLWRNLSGVLGNVIPGKDIKTGGQVFKATVDPSLLTKGSGGGFLSMVKNPENGKFVKQAEFMPSDSTSAMNYTNVVAAIMQILSIITSQYYLDKIDKNLESIDKKLQAMMESNREEKLAILLNAQKKLMRIVSREHVDDTDIIEIRSMHNQVGQVLEEYRIKYNDVIKRNASFVSKRNRLVSRIVDYKNQFKDIPFILQVIIEAEKIRNKLSAAEISIRMKRDALDPKLEELYAELQDDLKNSFTNEIKQFVVEDYDKCMKNAETLIDFDIFSDRNSRYKKKLIDDMSIALNSLYRPYLSIEEDDLTRLMIEEHNIKCSPCQGHF